MSFGFLVRGALIAALFPIAGFAKCPDHSAISGYLADFLAKRPSKGLGKDLTVEDAACARKALLHELQRQSGKPIGYKAVFTNPESQKRFGVTGPAWGAMYEGLILKSGDHVAATFGARPRHEADFIVVVKDQGLADANTAQEALDHISDLVPFIELPDLMLEGTPTGPELIATNAAFRGGVLGTKIRVDDRQAAALLSSLESMEVVLTDEVGHKEISREKGGILMSNPINAALWLAKALKNDGVVLKPGDLLSLGGFISSQPVRPGTAIGVQYLGLPGDPKVVVHFD